MPGRERRNLNASARLRPPRGDQGTFRSHQLVQIIQDRRALDQWLAAIEHKRRHPAQRIIRRYFVGIAKGRPGLMLEGQSIKPQRNCDTTDEGRVVLADKDHVSFASSFLIVRKTWITGKAR